jgi:integrase
MQYFARWLAAHPEWLPVGRGFEWSDLTEDLFDAWLTGEYQTSRKGHYANIVRRFYLWGADPETGHPDFSVALASVLRGLRIDRPAVGERVKSRDGRSGPLSREELELIFEACVTGAGTDRGRAMAWTFLETAIRSKQMYLLTNRDVELLNVEAEKDGFAGAPSKVAYQLKIPKIKQRDDIAKYHYLPLSEGCARLLLKLRKPDSGPDAPLFWWLPERFRIYIRGQLKLFSKDAGLRSPHLNIGEPESEGEVLHITPRRFRYGLATDRIKRKESPENVADMLGHEDTSCVAVYADTSPMIADDFQRATDYAIVPYIKLMSGNTSSLQEDSLQQNTATIASSTLRSDGGLPIIIRNRTTHYFYQDHRQSPAQDMSFSSIQWRGESENRINEMVAWARRKFNLIYPGQDFDGQLWDVTHLLTRTNASTKKTLGFTTLASTGVRLSSRPEDALPPYFTNIIKSWIVISNNVSLPCQTLRLNAARHLWDFLSTRWEEPTLRLVWAMLSEADMLEFEQFLLTYQSSRRRSLSPGTILVYIDHVQRLINFLSSRYICRQINYVPHTPSPRATAGNSLDVKKLMAEHKLPAPGVIECLSSIYHRLTTAQPGEVSDWLQIFISAVAILIFTGLRIGELVTLPFDCEVEESVPKENADSSDSYRYGLRYWLEKAHAETTRIRWISPTAEPIVRASIARIKRLTADARERAKILEADLTKVPLPPEFAGRTTLTRLELFTLLGYKSDRVIRPDQQELLPQHGRGQRSYFYVGDLEAYLLSRRQPLLYTVRHKNGTIQQLSESLLVIFARQSHSARKTPCRLLVEPVEAHTFTHYLSRPAALFKTYGALEEERRLAVNPHALRHWLIHVAYEGGMRMDLVLRYFEKQSASNVADYLHFSTEEADAYVPDELCEESFYVPE